MADNLAILGAGGHGRVVADAADAAGWTVSGLFDSSAPPGDHPWPIMGDAETLCARLAAFDGVVVALGDNDLRLAWTLQLAARGAALATIIHPTAWVSTHARMGGGTVILAGAVVGTGARLGRGVIVNTGASVDHDCVLGDGVHVSPGARLAGGVTIGERSWIGLGAVVREGLTLGDMVRVGAGAAVVEPVDSGLMVVGVPARPTKAVC